MEQDDVIEVIEGPVPFHSLWILDLTNAKNKLWVCVGSLRKRLSGTTKTLGGGAGFERHYSVSHIILILFYFKKIIGVPGADGRTV